MNQLQVYYQQCTYKMLNSKTQIWDTNPACWIYIKIVIYTHNDKIVAQYYIKKPHIDPIP